MAAPLSSPAPRLRPVSESLREYGRGIAGGLLFSLPLLYTMEVWWAGFTSHPASVLGYLVGTYVLLLGYNRYGGFRRDVNWFDVFTDSLEELGLGLVVSVVVLVLIGRIGRGTSLQEAVGMVVVEAGTVAIGVSVGTAQLGGQHREEEPEEDKRRLESADHVPAQLVIAFCGAVLFAANVAPTEEIVVIAAETSPWHLLGLAVLSLLLGGLILFQSDFTKAHRFTRRRLRRDVLAGTVVTYALALISSALVLWFFGRFAGNGPGICVAQVVVLGLASTLGASAGRLLIQS
ncbi:TIGR02587 family membrane protein [Corallococcus llansteffanensis]|uniref:TIGR02587 family membrane protein n=1 Tax=Corallococcus llansteffanensis TaxID=2316731 RepID=A0A3A8Q4B2_9BACT|nr:TIGR02587 family membrane protein [Corallococcus llansteffanensis]RKH63543.1 TIGR02587 family membrane protein [Corallococcus llansteffanensis]